MAEDQQQQQHAQNTEQHDSQQSLDPQPNGQQFSSGEQAPEQPDQMIDDIRKAVSRHMGGKRERNTKRLRDFQKAQRVNPRFKNPLRQKEQY
jgi:hypothetical protein